MKLINNTANELALNRSYSAKTRFSINSEGNIEQRTVLYGRETGSQLQPVFRTRHCKVQIGREGLFLRFRFPRKQMSPLEMEDCVCREAEIISDFLSSAEGEQAISNAECLLMKIA